MTSPSTRSADPSRKPDLSRNPDASSIVDSSALPRHPEEAISLGWLDALVQHRRVAYAFLVLTYVASFSGIWRIGVDSALYRGLARSIARGDGYVFAGEHHTHAYAGLPLLLAGLEKVFGESPLPGLIMISLMALATLWLIDALIRLRYPLWVATVITLGVGLNYRFVRQSHELMTDIPFMLGVMMTLYAYERLRMTLARGQVYPIATMLLGGLVLAAATRPTFGVLVIAMILGSAYAALANRDGKRHIHLAIIGCAAFVAMLLVLADPRTAISAPFTGKYELELREAVRELPATIVGQLRLFFGENLNDAFFSQDMSPLAIPFSILVLVGGVLVWRRNVVWGLMIFGLVLVTLPLSTVPRYYIMVMPMLWLGWILLLSKVALRSPKVIQGAVMMVGLGLPLLLNFGRVIGFIAEQRRGDWEWITRGANRQDAFYANYRKGAVPPLLGVARLIKEHTAPDDTIIGPSAHVLSYFADRRVLGERSIFFEKALSTYPSVLQKVAPDYAVFPIRLYEVSDPDMRELIRRRILIAMQTVASNDSGYLARVSVRPPPPDVKWTQYNGPEERATTRPRLTAEEKAEILRKKERRLELAKREAKQKRLARLEKQARIERREKIERRERLEKQRKIEALERREARERRERKAKRAANAQRAMPTTTPTTQPVSALDFPLIERPAWLDVTRGGAKRS